MDRYCAIRTTGQPEPVLAVCRGEFASLLYGHEGRAGWRGAWLNCEVLREYDPGLFPGADGGVDLGALYLAFCGDFPLRPDAPRQSGGWVGPDGSFFPCPYGAHDRTARRIAAGYYGRLLGGDELLERRGWLKVLSDGYVVGPGHDPRATQALVDTLGAIALAADQVWGQQIAAFIADCQVVDRP